MDEYEYYCNCCGTTFSEADGRKHALFDDEIACPMCGAGYDEDDGIIERYSV